ncbi:MAG: hypothetical protein ACOX01_03075 [Methanobrevibacter boviskoreani]|jgi:hypothetical protein|uniref:hypothetical protein n=1 Tax=Methanobrevibacter boviskoreani TaxID=1348249 RepID=UPI003D8D67B7
MNFKQKIGYAILLIVLLTIVVNIGAVNDFLSFHTDKTIQFDNSSYVVPDHWNTTDEMNLTGKNGNAMTNNYIILDCWDDWPENRMGSKSRARLRSLEKGGYVPLKTEVIRLAGRNVTREYYTNPSRDTKTQYDHIGVVYLFNKQDKNYCIEVHYFTTHDYNNKSYTKEVDDRVEDMIANMQNRQYNWYVSTFNRILNHQKIEWNI